MRYKGTRKFGKKRYALKWDSVTFGTYGDPDSARSVAKKKSNAKLWVKDYTDRGYDTKITTYRGGKEFKVWTLPR